MNDKFGCAGDKMLVGVEIKKNQITQAARIEYSKMIDILDVDIAQLDLTKLIPQDETIQINEILKAYKFNFSKAYLTATQKEFNNIVFRKDNERVIKVKDEPIFGKLLYRLMGE